MFAYVACANQNKSFAPPLFGVFSFVDPLPTWLTLTTSPITGTITSLILTDPPLGVFELEINTLFGKDVIRFTFYDCSAVYDADCCEPCNIFWFNQHGGWQSHIFDGVKTKILDAGSTRTWKQKQSNGDLETKIQTRTDAAREFICTTKIRTKTQIDILDSLRFTIQAYLLKNTQYIPIIISNASITKYQSTDGIVTASVSFRFANEEINQTQ
jgi:hypothetical protein